jgi:tRNA(Ile)-lysidine synthase
MKINQKFLQELIDKKITDIAVAVSGGCDSLALTFLLQEFCQKTKINLTALTIDHKIRKSSTQEAKNLAKLLKEKNISHKILTIPQNKIPKSNIEANLRQLRYEMLHQFCQKNQIEHLFLGHILSDVSENFLIRLFRGSGLDGLSAISEISTYQKIKLIRPLLNVSKDELKNYLKAKKIKWFEDETNEDEKFLRNKIRKFLNSFDPDSSLRVLQSKARQSSNIIHMRIKNAADEIANSRDFIDAILLQEAKKIIKITKDGFLINIVKLKKLDEKISLKILALILMENARKPYKPRLENLKNFHQKLINNFEKKSNFYNSMAKKIDEKNILIYPERLEIVNKTDLKTILKNIF